MPNVQGFIQQYAPVAADVGQRIGVAPDVLLGQWGLETGWGKSVIPGTNNLGNIKGPGVAATDNQTGSNDQYRAYASPQDFGNDFAGLIARKYQGAVGSGSDASAYGNALAKGGYAQDSGYANKLAGAVGMVRKFGDAIASAISGTANASELSPQQMSGAPVISATGQQIMPQATKQPAAPAQPATASTGDPLLDMARGVMAGSTAPSTPASAGTTPASPAPAADDPLLAMANSVMNGKAPAPASVSQTTNPGSTPAPEQQPGVLTSIGAGLGKGFGETVLGAQQLIGHGLQAVGANSAGDWLVNDANKGISNLNAQAAPYSAAHPVATGAGDFGGQMVASAPLAAIAPEIGAGGLLSRIGTGAVAGATGSLAQPVSSDSQSYWADKGKQAATGAAVGGVLNPLIHATGAALSPSIGAAQQRLLDAGVALTPGQILGGRAATMEAKATSLPIVGPAIADAQRAATEGFNRATYNEVLAPLGQTYHGPVGNDGVAAVQRTISNAYDNALSRLTFRADPQFQTDLAQLGNLANGLPAAQQRQFLNTVQMQIINKMTAGGTMDGPTLKGVQEQLGDMARGLGGDPSFDNRQLGAAIGQARTLIEDSLARNNPPDAVRDLANANTAYANYVRLRGAAQTAGANNQGGVFTAAQLNGAVRGADQSAGNGATATGNALMQRFAQDGQSVLGSKYPDSGTAGRGLLATMLSGATLPGMAFAPGATIGGIGAGIAGAAAYSPMGNALTRALLTARPGIARSAGNALMRGSTALTIPSAGSVAGSLGSGN